MSKSRFLSTPSGNGSGASSTASFRSRRSVVNSALVLARQLLGGSVDLTTLQGSVFDRVSGTLGDATYNAFCTDCTLVTINYCQRALEQFAEISAQGLQAASERTNVSAAQVQKIQEKRGWINHDYLVLELESGGSGKLHILAEKLTGRAEDVGIHIDALKDAEVEYRLHEGVRLYAMPCKTKISLLRIEEILKTATDPHYNLKDNNCWDYAFAATRWLLKECTARPGTRSTEYSNNCWGFAFAATHRLLNKCTARAGTRSPEYNRLKEMHDNLEGDLNRHSITATLKTALNSVRSS